MVCDLTWVQLSYYLRKGEVVAFTDPVFNLAREEDGVVALYVYPFWPLPFLGERVFYRTEKSYEWLKERYVLMRRSVVCKGMRLALAPRTRGVWRIIAQIYSRFKKE